MLIRIANYGYFFIVDWISDKQSCRYRAHALSSEQAYSLGIALKLSERQVRYVIAPGVYSLSLPWQGIAHRYHVLYTSISCF